MKKLPRLILIFLVFALMAALSAITALACSPEDSNPEHHENIIQTDEEKPTCLRGGYYVLECTVCGMRCTYQTDPAMPHSFGPWEVVQGKEPTCTQSGTKRAYCSTCNKWYEMPAPPTDHFWVIDSRVFATCTTSGYTRFICDDCGTEGDTVTMSALGHKFGAWFTTTQPTCMANGIQKRECTRCGATETKSIAKTDHKFGAWFTTTKATCMEEGIQTRECSQCGATERRGSSKTDHSWDAGTVVVQPTETREGVMEWRCSVCGMARTKPIPTLTKGSSDAPIPGSTDAPPPDAAASTPSDTAADKDKTSSEPGREQGNKDGKNDNINEPGSDTGKAFGDRGSKSDFGKNNIAQNALQKQEKDSSSKEPSAHSFPIVKVLLLVLVPVLLVTAGVILLLVRRKKTGQP